MSEKTLAVPKIFVLYKEEIFEVNFPLVPLSDEEREAAAKSVMDELGVFGQMTNNISSIDQVIAGIKKIEKLFFKLLHGHNFKVLAANMFLCEQDKVREYGKERKKKGGGVLNIVAGELFAEFPALKINDHIFYRNDAAKASNGGFDLQNILSRPVLQILKKQGLVFGPTAMTM